MKDVMYLILVVIIILFLLLLGPQLILALWMEFNPNNNKTEEVGGRVKETLQEKNLSLIALKCEYSSWESDLSFSSTCKKFE